MERYEDRLESSSYANDEVVGAGPSGRADYDGWVWIPERLFSRMQHRVVEDEALRVQLERLRAVAVAVRGAGPRTELVIEGP